MSKIRFGIIGFGNIGKRHAQHIQQHPEAELIAICDLPGFVAPSGYEQIPLSFSVDQFLKNNTLDVVNVCSPNYLHHPHTLAALASGKHVVCEKPMAMSTGECHDMIRAATESEKTIFVVKQNRYNPPVQQVKRLLSEQRLGRVFFVNINCFWNRNEEYYNETSWRGKRVKDGGCLFTQFSHFVDILYYLFGEIRNVKGQICNYNHPYTEVEDTGSLVMETLDGVLVNFNFSTCSYEKNMEGAFTILGEYGTVKIGGQYLNTIEYQHIRDCQLPEIAIENKSNNYGRYQGSMSNHDQVIDNVVQYLHGKADVMTNAHEGMKVVEMIERMYAVKEGFH
jgi:UDP-N-acetyl-2-amino-2-deoxyglucuronate dehydrogenase